MIKGTDEEGIVLNPDRLTLYLWLSVSHLNVNPSSGICF
jgi:hypothetical protein